MNTISLIAAIFLSSEPQMINGSIKAVDGSKIIVTTKDGAEKTVWAIGKTAPVLVDGKPADYGVLKAGVKVSIQADGDDAKKIRVIVEKEEAPKRLDVEFAGIKTKAEKIVYVVDASKSMDTYRVWEPAKAALIKSIERLSEDQQFEVVFFDDEVKPLGLNRGRLITGKTANIAKAAKAISDASATGGSDYRVALNTAVGMKPDAMFFISDGDGLKADIVDEVTKNNHQKLAGKQPTSIHVIQLHFPVEFLQNAFNRSKASMGSLAMQNNGIHKIFDPQSLPSVITNGQPVSPKSVVFIEMHKDRFEQKTIFRVIWSRGAIAIKIRFERNDGLGEILDSYRFSVWNAAPNNRYIFNEDSDNRTAIFIAGRNPIRVEDGEWTTVIQDGVTWETIEFSIPPTVIESIASSDKAECRIVKSEFEFPQELQKAVGIFVKSKDDPETLKPTEAILDSVSTNGRARIEYSLLVSKLAAK